MSLEDLMLNNQDHKVFTDKIKFKFLQFIKNSEIDIIEIGTVEVSNKDKTSYSIYPSIEEASKS